MVRLLGVEDLFLRDRLRLARSIELLEEAALEAGVAGAADLLNLEEERVGVAVLEPAHHLLRVAARLALEPEFLPRPAPVVHEARLQRRAERALVHPGHHEHAPGGRVLHDRGDEAVGVVFELRLHEEGWSERDERKRPGDLYLTDRAGRKVRRTVATTEPARCRLQARLTNATNAKESRECV